jgi:dTDP-4-dehydrorhamnose 3,5-epimerase
MKIFRPEIKGLVVFEPTVYEDDRGQFFETYRDYELNSAVGKKVEFVQENQSVSYKNVFRGFHYQRDEFAQAKLVRVVQGGVVDIVIDLRDSETYGKIHAELLNDQNRKQMYIPRGFAHGFLTLTDTAIFQYKCDNYYNKEFEAGVNPNSINFEWNKYIPTKGQLIINKRDLDFPPFIKGLASMIDLMCKDD